MTDVFKNTHTRKFKLFINIRSLVKVDPYDVQQNMFESPERTYATGFHSGHSSQPAGVQPVVEKAYTRCCVAVGVRFACVSPGTVC